MMVNVQDGWHHTACCTGFAQKACWRNCQLGSRTSICISCSKYCTFHMV